MEKRRKKRSKSIFGTSHTVSLNEAEYIYEKGAVRLIVGAACAWHTLALRRHRTALRGRTAAARTQGSR